MHIGVFILLLLSGERNFGVRLNKPYSVRVPMDIPVFTGTHADLLIVVRGLLASPGGVEMTSSWLDLEVVGTSPSLHRCFISSSPAATSGCSPSLTACSPSWSTVGVGNLLSPFSPPGGDRP